MAHKTFISYKFSEAQDLRDRIIKKLGKDANYYKGETSDSPNLSDMQTYYIKEKLKDMIYDSSVTIVIISPMMNDSKWIPWEISYSLRNVSRNNRTSRPNGIVCVVQKQSSLYGNEYGYSWFNDYYGNWNINNLPKILRNNINNKKYNANYSLPKDYISIVTEYQFLNNPSKYIDEAYEKAQYYESYYLDKMEVNW